MNPIHLSDGLKGDETILLVEGEEKPRIMCRVILQGRGYEVLEASQGSEANRLSDSHGGRIHLLLTNVGLPDMRGREVADQLVPRRPDMKVLYMDGHTSEPVAGELMDAPSIVMPFTPGQLAKKAREVLDDPIVVKR